MSLVGALSGAIANYNRSSYLEDKFNALMDKINRISDRVADVGDALSSLDADFGSKQSQLMFGAYGQNGQTPDQQAIFTQLQALRQRYHQKRNILIIERSKYERMERKLQREKTVLEVQRRIAEQTAQTLNKMEGDAVKRFAVNI